MEQVDSTIQEFGKQMGIANLDASNIKVISFIFEKKGVLFFEKLHGEILIYLARKVDFADHQFCEKILKLSHYSADFSVFMSASFKDKDKLVILSRVQSSEFTLQMIEKIIDQLTAFYERLR